ncbi:MAG: hypothetical protein GVY29_13695 [Spirochaetes bacterium]|nr:hypothetical protein [Spirochaetota bacterium]
MTSQREARAEARAEPRAEAWGEHTPRISAFLLHLSVFLTLFVVILWPSSSYVAFFRYGNVPIVYEFAAFVLPLALAIGSAYQGVLTTPPGASAGGVGRVLWELFGAACLAAVAAPIVVIGGSVSRAPLTASAEVLAILLSTAIVFRPIGILTQGITRNRSLQYVLMWLFVIGAFYATAYWLPPANPIVAVTNAAEATRIGGGSIFFVELEAHRPLMAAVYHLGFAGFMTVLVVLSGYAARHRRGAES